MIFLQLDPLSKSVAITEILLLLMLAALVGWLLARWVSSGQLNRLREAKTQREAELHECRAGKAQPYPQEAETIVTHHFVAPATVASAADNLKLVEGIGPKIEKLLNADGIFTFARLAATPSEHLGDILKAAGLRFQIHDPGTWPEQAALARDGKWEDLKAMQAGLRAGRA